VQKFFKIFFSQTTIKNKNFFWSFALDNDVFLGFCKIKNPYPNLEWVPLEQLVEMARRNKVKQTTTINSIQQ
jgi:hypothetical protein